VDRVGIVVAGHVGCSSLSPGRSYKELVLEAATRAYQQAGLDPRRDVDSFVCASEDYWEGTSIFDAYVPDQLGAALRPVQTIAGDGLLALAAAVMLIRSGAAHVVAVEAHLRGSDIDEPARIAAFALDPVFERPLGLHPWFVAGLEMRRFLDATATAPEECAAVVVANRGRALANPSAAYGAALTAADVAASELVADPLRALDCAGLADGAVVVVLAGEERARALARQPVWVDGVGWATETPSLSGRSWGAAEYARLAALQAYRQAGIQDPAGAIDVADVDDTFSYKQLQHLEAVGLAEPGTAGRLLAAGDAGPGRTLPAVNPTGGTLGRGSLAEADGLLRVADLVAQLTGEAGACQVEGARTGLAVSWRGVPAMSGAVAVLSAGPGA
jgi:acetyl-CoA C-acetyltransferase